MNVQEIRIESAGDREESLALTLLGVAAAEGQCIDYDDLMAALGLSLLTVAAESDSFGRWCGYGRDAFLTEAAALFGLGLRDLHPPDAAVGLARCAEYAQHFEASYAPLICRSLEHGQPVLAWMGWPQPYSHQWGVITGYNPQQNRFIGVTLAADGRPVLLAGPSVQLYSVESYEPRMPDRSQLRDAFLRHSAAVLGDRLHEQFRVTTGPRAFDAWMEQWDRWAAGPRAPAEGWHDHVRYARFLRDARSSAVRFAARFDHPTLEQIASLARQQWDLLGICCDEAAIGRALQASDARSAVISAVRRVQDAEEQLAAILRA